MIINDKQMKLKSLEAISSAKDCTLFQILPTGELQINKHFKSYVFLAYVGGNWFASFGDRKGTSITIPEKGLNLFVCGNNSLWIQNKNNDIDISTPIIPLDESTHVVLFSFSGKSYTVIIADGSKYPAMISTYIKKTPGNTLFLIMALTSLIRQYDDKAADEILQFWFRKTNTESPSAEHQNQIQFASQESMTEMRS